MQQYKRPTVAEREDEYRQRRRTQVISPERVDPFADGKCVISQFIIITIIINDLF